MSQFVELTCCQCRETFFVSPDTYGVLKRSSQNFYCPFGHQQHFPQGKSDAQKLREELERERRMRQSAEQNVAFYADEAKREGRRAAGYKGQATKLAKRAKAGVCPCCQRTVSQLAAHMKAKHPEYSANVIELDVERKAAIDG